jgi:plasmid stabilization system protein ParE
VICLSFTTPALADLKTIHSYIAAENPGRAQAFVQHIRDRCRFLRTFPRMGRARPEYAHVDPGMRSISVKPVTIFYRYLYRTETRRGLARDRRSSRSRRHLPRGRMTGARGAVAATTRQEPLQDKPFHVSTLLNNLHAF